MYSNIEKEYKKELNERKFHTYYCYSIMIITIAVALLSLFFKMSNTLIYILYFSFLVLSILLFFYKNYTKTMKTAKINKKEKFKVKIKEYANQIEAMRITQLAETLRKYNFKTKEDLKLAIEYYSNKQPRKIKSDFWSWIVSISLTFASLIGITYNEAEKRIDQEKLATIMGSTLGFIIIIVFSVWIIKQFINLIIFPKYELYTNLSEDLTYIYLNFKS